MEKNNFFAAFGISIPLGKYIFVMMNTKQFSYCDMTKKTVVNVADGRTLGNVCDIVFNSNACVVGFVVPGKKSFFRSITSAETVFIPWNRIVKIGSDVMLVSLAMMPQGNYKNACTFEADEQQKPAQEEQAFGQTVYHDE